MSASAAELDAKRRAGDMSASAAQNDAKRRAGDLSASEIREWVQRLAKTSRTVTTTAIAYLMHQVVEDGTINEEDEYVLRDMLSAQQSVWNVLMITDTLLVSMTLPFVSGSLSLR